MFGKTTNLSDTASIDGPSIEDFFGDETAAAEAVRMNDLHDRVTQVEAQISSQFTSLATYAQIAQEQIELARSEAKAATDRSEHRLTGLIERERADRLSAANAGSDAASAPGVVARLDALEQNVAQMVRTLDRCFTQQKALADTINKLFELRPVAAPSPVPTPEPLPTMKLEPATVVAALAPPRAVDTPRPTATTPRPTGPIPGLSLRVAFE